MRTLAIAVLLGLAFGILGYRLNQIVEELKELKELRQELRKWLAPPNSAFYQEYKDYNIHELLADIHRYLKVLTK